MSTYTAVIDSTLTFEQGTSIKGLAFCPRGENVAVRLFTGDIVVINLVTLTRTKFYGRRDALELPLIMFTPNGKYIVSGYGYMSLAIYHVSLVGAPVRVIEIGEMLNCIDVTRDSATIITGAHNVISTWELATGYLKRRYIDEYRDADDRKQFDNVLSIDDAGHKIMAIGNNGSIWFLQSAEGISRSGDLISVSDYLNPPSHPTCACLMVDKNHVVTGSVNDNIDFWDAASGKRIRSVKTLGFISSISVMPNGSTCLLSGRKNGSNYRYNIWTHSAVHEHGEPTLLLDGVEHDIKNEAWDQDCTIIATAGDKAEVTLWRVSVVEAKRAGRKI